MARTSQHSKKDKARSWLEQGIELQRGGDFEGALACYARIPDQHPAYADALHLSGIIYAQQGNPAKGTTLIGQAVALCPRAPLFRVNLANAQEALGDLPGAEQTLRTALAIDVKFVPALYNLGNLLCKQQRDDEAIGYLDQALVAEPSHVNACVALGDLLLRKRMPVPALQLARRAKQMAPSSLPVSDLYIGALLANKQYGVALDEFAMRLEREPADFALLQGKAYCLQKRACYSDAAETFRAALASNPGHRDVGLELAQLHTTMGDPDSTLRSLAAMLDGDGKDAVTYSNWLFALNYSDAMSPTEVLEKHRGWETLVELDHPPYAHPPVPSPRPRLRLGYISEDFKQHSVAWFIENVLAGHRRDQFDVFAYFVNPDPDEVTGRIRGRVDCFRELHKSTPAEIADAIRRDEIDIAIELAGHTSVRILEAMLYRPAPVQISWLGYPNTTGVSAIDYRISDPVADPPGAGDAWSSERVLRLPDCFHCYRPERKVEFDPVPPHVRNGYITFGSFNVLPKLSASCCNAWSRIVSEVPDARLMLKNRALHDPVVRQRVLQRFDAAGLPPERIVILGDQAGWADHMARYRDVDIALDPFPYNGTTTTCEALWMSVPVVTMLGDRHAARVGASLLTAVGHSELVTRDWNSYVAEAIRLASDTQRMTELHARLHHDLMNSPICDAPRFIANLEAAYLEAWQRHCVSHH